MIRVIVVVSCYVAAQMLADITSLKIAVVLGMSMDAGTFIYPITFTLRDIIHKTIGAKGARILIFTAAGINIFMALFFWFSAWLPADMMVGPQTEFALVLSPVWRIVIASIVAEVIAELIDTEVYQKWVDMLGHRYQWGRVLSSNIISVPIDSLLFVWIAFGGVLPTEVVWSIFVMNVLVKGVTTIVSMPLIYTVPECKIKFVEAASSTG